MTGNKEKCIVYVDMDTKSICDKYVVYEDRVPKGKLNIWRVLWLCLFKKCFLSDFTEVVKYSLMHHKCYRGTGSSDVFLFVATNKINSLFRK